MLDILMVSSTHDYQDVRIYHKETKSLVSQGYNVGILMMSNKKLPENEEAITYYQCRKPKNRFLRVFSSIFVLLKILSIKSKVVQIHDGELLHIAPLVKLFGRKFVYDAHEPMAFYISNKRWIPVFSRRFIYKCVKVYERFYTLFTSGIVTCYRDVQNEYFPIRKNVVMVRNFPFRQKISVAKENTIIYVGLISRKRMIPEIAENSRKLIEYGNLEGFKIKILGYIPEAEDKQFILDSLSQSSNDSLTFSTDRIPYSQALEEIAKAKYGLFFANKDFISARYTLPTKIFDYMMFATVPVSSDLVTLNGYIDNGINGILIPEGRENDFLSYISKNHEKYDSLSQRAFDDGYNNFNWEIESEKLIELYNKLLCF